MLKVLDEKNEKTTIDAAILEVMETAERNQRTLEDNGKCISEKEFAAIREKELAEIGEAFKTGLTRKITVPRPVRLKKPSQRPPR